MASSVLSSAQLPVVRLPVTVVTGFLGSGKTTMLNALLATPAFSDTAVVVNEVGEIGLDHLLITSSRENIVLLDAGCLCCTVLDSLRETLVDLLHRRSAGTVPAFRRVIIETTGLADPTPILQTLMRDPVVAPLFAVHGVVTVVDARFAIEQIDRHREAAEQISLADTLVVAKTDLTGNAVPAALDARLTALNPRAQRLTTDGVHADPTLLLADIQPFIATAADDRHVDHEHGAGVHDHDIGSLAFTIDHAVGWAGVAAWTAHLRLRWGDDLLRCKGLIALRDGGGPLLVNGVRTLFDMRRLPEWPDEIRGARIVLIGRKLDRATVLDGLAWLDTPDGVSLPGDAAPPPWLSRTAPLAPLPDRI